MRFVVWDERWMRERQRIIAPYTCGIHHTWQPGWVTGVFCPLVLQGDRGSGNDVGGGDGGRDFGDWASNTW